MTKYGFTGLSGAFYPLADDPMTAQKYLDDHGIERALVAYDMDTQGKVDECEYSLI